MSINVNVHGNPINIRRGKMLISDIEHSKEKERQKRRKLRLEQVRQQSKDIAEKIRNRVRNETNKQLSKLEKLQGDELKRWKAKKMLTLQRQYNECLHEIGSGHKQAALQLKPEDVLKSQKKIYSKVAKERGVKAIGILHKQQQKQKNIENMFRERRNLVQNIEKIRSAFVSDLEKSDNTIQNKLKCKECVETNKISSKSKSCQNFDNRENIMPDCKLNFVETETKQNTQTVKSIIPDKVESASMSEKKNQKISIKNSNLQKKSTNKEVIEDKCIDSFKIREEPYKSKCIQTEFEYPASADLECNINETSEKIVNESGNNEGAKPSLTNNAHSKSKSIQNQVCNFEELNKEVFSFVPDTRISELISKRDRLNVYDHSSIPTKQNDPEKKISQNYVGHSKNINSQDHLKTITSSLTSEKKLLPKVECYDHDNRFSHQYTARSDLVQRDNLSENLFRDDNKIEEIIPKERDTTRGKMALHKEKIDRDYKNLLEDLAVIQKEERLLSSRNVNIQNAHLSDERLKYKKQKRQKQMESVFEEGIHEHHYTPIITVESVEESNILPIRNKIIQKPQLNVATWDLPQSVQNKNKKQTLENLMHRINIQKKLLLEEVKMLPEQSKLEKIGDRVDCKKNNIKKQSISHSVKRIGNSSINKSDLFDIESTNNKKTEENVILKDETENITFKENIKRKDEIQHHTSKVDSLENKDICENISEQSNNKDLSLEKMSIDSNIQIKKKVITSALVHHSANSSDFISNEEKYVNASNSQISKNNPTNKIFRQTENNKSKSITCSSENNREHTKLSKKQHIEIHIVLKENDINHNIDSKIVDNNVIKIKKNETKNSKLNETLNKKGEMVNIEITRPVQNCLNIMRPLDTDSSFLCLDHRNLENSDIYVENSESTSYMSLPQIATFKFVSDIKNVNVDDLIEKKNQLIEIKQSKIEMHENVKKHINKLLKMSKSSIDNLCISSVSNVSTPDSNIIQTSKNIYDTVDYIEKQSENSSKNHTSNSTDHSSEFFLSSTYSSLNTKNGFCEVNNTPNQSHAESNLQICSNSLYPYNSSENNHNSLALKETVNQNLYENHHQNMLIKYSELTENCTKRINDLTSLINELRSTKTLCSQKNEHFISNDTEKKSLYKELSISKNNSNIDDYENKQTLQQNQVELENKVLRINKDINEFNLQLYKPTQGNKKRNSIHPSALNQNTLNLFSEIYHTDSAVENKILLRDIPSNFNFWTELPQCNFKVKNQENDISTDFQSDISNSSVFVPNLTLNEPLQQIPSNLKNNTDISILDINTTNNNNTIKYHSKPPLSLVQNAIRHNIDICTIPPHDLSTIVEVDTPVVLKVDSSKNLSLTTEMSHTNISKKQTVINNSKQKDSTKNGIDICEKKHYVDNMQCEKYIFDEKLLLSNTGKKKKSNEEVNSLPQTSIELSSIDSPLSDDFEIALKKMGIDWGISTIRKTQAALQLSSSSSSLDISLKKLGVKLLDDSNTTSKTKENSVNLKDVLQKQLLKKLTNSSSTSTEEIQIITDNQNNIKKCDKVFQDSSITNSSEVKQKRDKSQGRTSTPVSLVKTIQTTSIKSNVLSDLFSDNDISSVKTPNVENLSLVIPNYSLEISNPFNKCNSS